MCSLNSIPAEQVKRLNLIKSKAKGQIQCFECRICVHVNTPNMFFFTSFWCDLTILKEDNWLYKFLQGLRQGDSFRCSVFDSNPLPKTRYFTHNKWTRRPAVFGTDSLSSAMEAEMRTSCPSRYSVVMRSLHWTSSPSGPPLKAFSAILKPDSFVSRPKCTRIWQRQKLQE